MLIVGKLLISLAIAIYAFIPPIVNLMTDSHVFHQQWMPHARMHTVWMLGSTFGIGLVSLYLIWMRRIERQFSINLAVVLSGIVYGAFFLSASTISLYGGELSDLVDGSERAVWIGYEFIHIWFGVTDAGDGLGNVCTQPHIKRWVIRRLCCRFIGC